jgi:hypothetical protein
MKPNKRIKDGYENICKICYRIQHQEYYYRIKQYSKTRYKYYKEGEVSLSKLQRKFNLSYKELVTIIKLALDKYRFDDSFLNIEREIKLYFLDENKYVSNIIKKDIKVRQCLQCLEHKELSEFYLNRSVINGYTNKCKQCLLENKKNRKLTEVIDNA